MESLHCLSSSGCYDDMPFKEIIPDWGSKQGGVVSQAYSASVDGGWWWQRVRLRNAITWKGVQQIQISNLFPAAILASFLLNYNEIYFRRKAINYMVEKDNLEPNTELKFSRNFGEKGVLVTFC